MLVAVTAAGLTSAAVAWVIALPANQMPRE